MNLRWVDQYLNIPISQFLGENFTGQTLVIKNTTPQSVLSALTRSNRDTGIHVNLKEDDVRKKFNDNVNSVECLCESLAPKIEAPSKAYAANRLAAPISKYGTSSP